jgi:SsrA-binding protein
MTKPVDNPDIVAIAENRRARHDYAVLDTYECGFVLLGTEVKSLRARHVNFGDAYALLKDGEVFLIGLKIEPYIFGTHENHEKDRTRKLLLNRREIAKLQKDITRKGLTLIPLKLYFKRGRAKVLIAIAQGKTNFDKRQDLKRKDADREVARVMRRG